MTTAPATLYLQYSIIQMKHGKAPEEGPSLDSFDRLVCLRDSSCLMWLMGFRTIKLNATQQITEMQYFCSSQGHPSI